MKSLRYLSTGVLERLSDPHVEKITLKSDATPCNVMFARVQSKLRHLAGGRELEKNRIMGIILVYSDLLIQSLLGGKVNNIIYFQALKFAKLYMIQSIS